MIYINSVFRVKMQNFDGNLMGFQLYFVLIFIIFILEVSAKRIEFNFKVCKVKYFKFFGRYLLCKKINNVMNILVTKKYNGDSFSKFTFVKKWINK